MSNLSIKDVPEDWAEALRQRAARNHRSLQGELLAMVEQVTLDERRRQAAAAEKPRITLEEFCANRRLRYPHPIDIGPSSVELIRQDRDSR